MVLSRCFPGRCLARGDHASLEDAERVLLLRALVANLDDLRQRMGDEWKSFSNELFHRILPILTHEGDGGLDVSALRSRADEIKEQLLTWPGERARHLRELAVFAIRGATGLVLPKRWREKQELLNLFQQMYAKLERGLGPNQDVGTASNPGDSTSGKGYMEVAIFFCTLRAPSGCRTPSDYFGKTRAHAAATGMVRVSLPDFDEVASNGPDLPYMWRSYQKRPTGNTGKGLEIASCLVLDIDFHVSHMVERRGRASREAIVFVHGFNCRFATEAKYMALYAYKMRSDVPFFLFSWPSFQSIDDYDGDQANASWAVRHFADFLQRLMTSYRLDKVHVFAHSMGSQVALGGLLRLTGWSAASRGAARPGQLVLAAPDFDTGEFFEMQGDLEKLVDRVSVYCSANDQALRMSQRVHAGLPRLGRFRIDAFLSESRHVALSDKVDVIDVSGFDKSVVGHDYAFTSTPVIDDILEVLRDARPAEARPAAHHVRVDKNFWYWRIVGARKRAPKKSEEEVVESQMDEGMDKEGDSLALGRKSAEA